MKKIFEIRMSSYHPHSPCHKIQTSHTKLHDFSDFSKKHSQKSAISNTAQHGQALQHSTWQARSIGHP